MSTSPLARCVQLVRFSGVVSGDVELDVLVWAVRMVLRDGVEVPALGCVQFALRTSVAAATVEPDGVAKAVQHVVRHSAQVSSSVGRAAGASCRRGGG